MGHRVTSLVAMLEYLLLLISLLRAVVQSRSDLVAENLLLRQQLALRLATPSPATRPVAGPIRSRPVLGGLHHIYERAA